MVRYQSSHSVTPTPSPAAATGMLLNGTDQEVFEKLRALHADEFAYLQKHLRGTCEVHEKSWWHRCFHIVLEYMKFVALTWFKCAWSLVFFPLTLADWVATIVLSIAACSIMTVLFFWCLLCSVPLVKSLANLFCQKMFDGLSIVNIAYPRIFKDLSEDHVRAARAHLSKPPKEMCLLDAHRVRVFNLDAAKMLLQCAALMYERTGEQTRKAARAAANHKVPPSAQIAVELDDEQAGMHIRQVCGEESAEAVKKTLDQGNVEEDTIRDIAMNDLRLHYYPVSECNSMGSAFCALFWDPTDSFIIVSFKGTTPTDFSEWRTDFTFQMRSAKDWLNGFGRVHEGFMSKIFPRQINSSVPYDTIVKAIGVVSDHLHQKVGRDKKINVWITGHSLGCALASVAYSRMVNEARELGPNVRVRDAYLFAAPILCDVYSAAAFNNRMNHFSQEQNFQKTMWRVTNGLDAVACSLPDVGDDTRWSLSPWNLFSFSHLGAEIKMRCAPTKCIVAGNHITPGTTVRIESAFHLDALDHETPLQKTLAQLQDLPLVGRILAHAPGFYWTSLLKVAAGACEWEEEE